LVALLGKVQLTQLKLDHLWYFDFSKRIQLIGSGLVVGHHIRFVMQWSIEVAMSLFDPVVFDRHQQHISCPCRSGHQLSG